MCLYAGFFRSGAHYNILLLGGPSAVAPVGERAVWGTAVEARAVASARAGGGGVGVQAGVVRGGGLGVTRVAGAESAAEGGGIYTGGTVITMESAGGQVSVSNNSIERPGFNICVRFTTFYNRLFGVAGSWCSWWWSGCDGGQRVGSARWG